MLNFEEKMLNTIVRFLELKKRHESFRFLGANVDLVSLPLGSLLLMQALRKCNLTRQSVSRVSVLSVSFVLYEARREVKH